MSLTPEAMQLLADMGLSLSQVIEVARANSIGETDAQETKDDAAERRRAYDRERKRRLRDADNSGKSGGIPVDKVDASKAEMSANSTGKVAEFHRKFEPPRARVREITLTSEITGEVKDISSLRSDSSSSDDRTVTEPDDIFGGSPPERSVAVVRPDLVRQAYDAYNLVAERLGLAKATKLTDERRRKLKARLADVGPQGWGDALRMLAVSPHCLGHNDRGWRADLDFMLRPDKLTRIIEGGYERKSPNGNGTHGSESGGVAGRSFARTGQRGPVGLGEIIARRRAERGE